MKEYTVLVVDDDKEIRKAIAIYLQNEEITVIEAEDGLVALKKIRRKRCSFNPIRCHDA